MKDSNSTNPQAAAPQDMGFSPWQRLKSKRISYLTLPLLLMATVTEFVILSTGWKYQQVVCLPQGMGVTFFGIGPIGATILACELLKLPLAIWTASRCGWQKGFMLLVGLPLICVLTFQLVKDMAVYEMGVAMTPASQMLEKAMEEEIKITQLNGELAAIEQKKTEREQKLAEIAAKRSKAKADLEDALKRNDEARQDAINLTDFQKKELSDVEARQAAIIQQFNSDTEQLTKQLTDLRARREVEVGRATKWNAEEARIENAYKAKMIEYANAKATYEKDKAEYDSANFLKRKFMHEPVSPGVPPERESNTVLKPTAIAELDEQIKSKEAELLNVNNKRRDRVAQVEADARRVREEYDKRSTDKREKTDSKREELAAAQTALLAELNAEEKQIDQEVAAVVKNVDGIRAEIDASRKKAESFYEAREASIRKTQVHRIATTVEIVRGLIKGERPMSIKATAKERGDILTDQISMVRIWVYPVLAFIVAFLPTLMVEIGFSTVFQPERQRPAYRLGFFGRRLHELYTRAGRQKILRFERLAKQASGEIAAREKALAETKEAANRELFEKEADLLEAREAMARAANEHEEQLSRIQEEHATQAKAKEEEWVAKLAGMADSLNRTVLEKDALRDLQKSEIERQIQMRQNAWSDRVTQLRQELDEQRTAAETERTALMQEHQNKLLEVTEDCKTQVIQARRQMADAELVAVEKTARLEHDLKEALHARDTAESQLKHQVDSLSTKLTQAQEDAARHTDKAVRQEKLRFDRQQSEFEKTLRQREEDSAHQLKQREQELTLAFEGRLADEKNKVEQAARLREAELERQMEARAREVDTHWKQEVTHREDAAQTRLKQREQQLQAQAESRLNEIQSQATEQLRRRELELERQLEAQSREAENRFKQELQQKELAFQARLKQREQELAGKAEARETEWQNHWASDLRVREEEWERRTAEQLRQRELESERQLEAQSREAESRFKQELQQKELAFQARLKQREQELAGKAEAHESELQNHWASDLRVRQEEWERQTAEQLRRRELELERQFEAQGRDAEARFKQELQQKELVFQARLKQREQELAGKAEARETELQNQWAAELRGREEEWERQAEARVHAAESRFSLDAQQKEELFQSRSRQRDQQWQMKLDAVRVEMQAQTKEALRRRDQEAEATVRELEGQLRKEMQQKEEAFQAKARQREQELAAELTAQAEARQMAARTQWEAEAEKRTRTALEPLKTLLARTEEERDEARLSASEGVRQVQHLEKKLTEASSFLSNWRNGKTVVGTE